MKLITGYLGQDLQIEGRLSTSESLRIDCTYVGNISSKNIIIVGENGSGKTSMVSSILGLLDISSGSITYNSSTDKELVIGYVPQKIEFPEHFQLTVTEYLKYSAHIS